MRDQGWTPPRDEDVSASQVGQVEGAGLPLAGVVQLGAVATVAKVMNCNVVATDVGVSGLGVVGLPVATVGRLEGEPPQGDDRETGEEYKHADGTAAKEEERPEHQDEVQHRQWHSQTGDPEVEIQGYGRPCGQEKSYEYQESEKDLTQQVQVVGSFLVEI